MQYGVRVLRSGHPLAYARGSSFDTRLRNCGILRPTPLEEPRSLVSGHRQLPRPSRLGHPLAYARGSSLDTRLRNCGILGPTPLEEPRTLVSGHRQLPLTLRAPARLRSRFFVGWGRRTLGHPKTWGWRWAGAAVSSSRAMRNPSSHSGLVTIWFQNRGGRLKPPFTP